MRSVGGALTCRIPPPPLDAYLVCTLPRSINEGRSELKIILPRMTLMVYIYSRELIYSAHFSWDINSLSSRSQHWRNMCQNLCNADVYSQIITSTIRRTATSQNKTLDLRGFDSNIFLFILRGGISRSIGSLPEISDSEILSLRTGRMTMPCTRGHLVIFRVKVQGLSLPPAARILSLRIDRTPNLPTNIIHTSTIAWSKIPDNSLWT